MSSKPFSRASQSGGSPFSSTTDVSAPLVQMASTTKGSWLLMASCKAVCPSCVLKQSMICSLRIFVHVFINYHLLCVNSFSNSREGMGLRHTTGRTQTLIADINTTAQHVWGMYANQRFIALSGRCSTWRWCRPGAPAERGRSCCPVSLWPCAVEFVHQTWCH